MHITRRWEPKARVLAFFLLSLAYVAWSYTSELGGLGGDNAVYLLSAEHLSPFSDTSTLAASYFASSQYPPLFPLVLGLLGASSDFLVAHLAVTSFLLIALFVLYRWQRSLGFSPGVSFASALLFAGLPGTYFHTLEILSENLYLMLSLLALWTYNRAEASKRQDWLFGAAAAVAAATLTRTAGITLLVALLTHLFLADRSVRQKAIAVAIALGPVAAWHLWRSGGGYTTALIAAYGTSPIATLLDRLQLHATALWVGWIDNFISAPPFALAVAITAFGALCIAGLAVRTYVRTLDGLYVSLYLLLMLIWPFPGESQRFIFPVLPVLMVQGLWLLQKLPKLDFASRRLSLAPIVALTALALVATPQLLLHLGRFATPLPAELSPFKHTAGWYHPDPNIAIYQIHHSNRIVAALSAAGAAVPPDECILAIKPSIVSLYTKRISKSPPAATSPADFDLELKRRGCSYLFLVAFSSPTFNQPFYPLARLEGRVQVLQETRLAGPDSPPVALLARLSESTGPEKNK